jgi:ATP-dependent DNA helicase RecG
MELYDDIGSLKGIGPKMKTLLNDCGIFTIVDILLYLPRDYEKIYIHKDTSKIIESKVILNCTVVRIDRDIKTKNRKVLTNIVFKAGNNLIKGRWFNQPYMKDKFVINQDYIISGKLQEFRGEQVLLNPIIINTRDSQSSKLNLNTTYSDNKFKLMPKYPLKEGLTNNFMIKIISEILGSVKIVENFPEYIIKKYKLCTLENAINNIHRPKIFEDLVEAKRRIKFQELFTYSLKILMLKDYINNSREGIAYTISSDLKKLKEKLPFNLTNAQSKVMREILLDQKSSKQMNRLVQGDVGSGKTIVAIISMFNVVKNGYQAAMMAPTEILANQHYNEITTILKEFNIRISLLSGNIPLKQKDKIKQDLKEGNIDILVGTHALLEENVQFNNLGMVVTDEQHRFGVMQRSKLFSKGKAVDVLVMTATPIPRTLALYLYGDLDVSIIDELPPGRQKIETFYIEERKRDKVYNFALSEITNGRQVYVVCPLVEENEELNINSVTKLYELLKQNYFNNIEVAILHGKMNNKVKDEIMCRFKNGEIKVLVSTTVIEVGINVPNASVMIIENAERFGLSQLHQLRGRVGRGRFKSYCILVANIKNEIVRKRLDIIQENNDGFKIAEEDLKIRGSGELFGLKQHGENNLLLADVIEDIDLLKLANIEAKLLLNSKNEKDIKIKDDIMKKLEYTSKFICFN